VEVEVILFLYSTTLSLCDHVIYLMLQQICAALKILWHVCRGKWTLMRATGVTRE
jgi:hypothetical protein